MVEGPTAQANDFGSWILSSRNNRDSEVGELKPGRQASKSTGTGSLMYSKLVNWDGMDTCDGHLGLKHSTRHSEEHLGFLMYQWTFAGNAGNVWKTEHTLVGDFKADPG